MFPRTLSSLRPFAAAPVLAIALAGALVPTTASAAVTAPTATAQWVQTPAKPLPVTDNVKQTVTTSPLTKAQVGKTLSITMTTSGSTIDCRYPGLGFTAATGWTRVAATSASCSSTKLVRSFKVTSAMTGRRVAMYAYGAAASSATSFKQTSTIVAPTATTATTRTTVTATVAKPAPVSKPRITTPTPAPTTPVTSSTQTTGASLGLAVPATDLLWKTPTERDAILNKVAATGAKWMRVDVALDQLTWDGPQQIDWPTLDATVTAARARGLNLIGVIQTLPKYARPAGAPMTYGPTTQAQRDVVSNFAGLAAKRYQGKIDTWEVWNEENLTAFWYPTPNAANYTALLKQTYASIKAAAPNSTVLSGGTGGKGATADIDALQFITQMYASGAKPYFDAMGVHAYAAPQYGNLGEFLRLPNYRAIMDNNGDTTKQLWITEGGTRVASGFGTEAVQADNTAKLVAAWKAVHNHGPMMFFSLLDDADPGFGLLRPDGSARPAYAALQAVAATKA